jgi:C2H2-type zinc finger/Zinc-finger of C2H2 type
MSARSSYPLRALLIGRCTSRTGGTRIGRFRCANAVSKVAMRQCSPISTQPPPTGRGAFECGVCGQSFASRLALQQHRVAKNDGLNNNVLNIYRCCYCERTFATPPALMQHLAAKHNLSLGDKPNDRYQVYPAISPHISSHGEPQWLLAGSTVGRVPNNAGDELEEFPYSCDGCERKFRELKDLLQHNAATHTGLFTAFEQQQQLLGKPSRMMPLRFLLSDQHDNSNRQHNDSHEIHDDDHCIDWDDYNDLHDDDD